MHLWIHRLRDTAVACKVQDVCGFIKLEKVVHDTIVDSVGGVCFWVTRQSGFGSLGLRRRDASTSRTAFSTVK